MTLKKSSTDQFWNARAVEEKDKNKVNIADLPQREIETDFLVKHLHADDKALEVGCGNGFLTKQIRAKVKHVDSFDFSENMVETAKELHGEINNRFFHDSILSPQNISNDYDVVVCIRVLINLRDIEEQKIAIKNAAKCLKASGRLVLIEGYQEGFEQLNKLRQDAGLEVLKPAPINYYSKLSELMPTIEEDFIVHETMNTGCFDFLTRVIYPALVGTDVATGPADFHEKILPVAKHFNPADLKPLARLHGFVLEKK